MKDTMVSTQATDYSNKAVHSAPRPVACSNERNGVVEAQNRRKNKVIARRSQAKCRKREKQRFACKRRTKNSENWLSLASEMQKMGKTAFRL